MSACFRFRIGSKEISETLPPFRADSGCFCRCIMGNSNRREGAQSKRCNVTAGTSKRFHTVAGIVNMPVIEPNGHGRAVGLEIFAMDSAACFTVSVFHAPEQIADTVFGNNHLPGICNIFRNGLLDKLFQSRTDGCFVSSVHNVIPFDNYLLKRQRNCPKNMFN